MYISISVTIFLCLCLGVEGQQILSATRPSPKSNLRSVNKDFHPWTVPVNESSFTSNVMIIDTLNLPGNLMSDSIRKVALLSDGLDINTITATGKGFDVIAASVNDLLGSTVDTAGDVNGDGYADMLIVARTSIYVIFGRSVSTPLHDINLATSIADRGIGYQIFGEITSVHSAGDFNHDGYDDIIIGYTGYPTAGIVYVIFGHSSNTPFSDINLASSITTAGIGFQIFGNSRSYGGSSDKLGAAVSSAGDVNGDGYDDIIISATNAGVVYVIFGHCSSTPLSDIYLSTTSIAANGYLSSSIAAGGIGFQVTYNLYHYHDMKFGFSVDSTGDVNGDGFDDIIIGSHYTEDEFGEYFGRMYVIFGHSDSNPFVDIYVDEIYGSGRGFEIYTGVSDLFPAYSMSGAGDVNGDGYSDIIIATFNSTQLSRDHPIVYVVLGHSNHVPFTNVVLGPSITERNAGFRIIGTNATAVNTAGDVNGDGYTDMVISGNGTYPLVIFGSSTVRDINVTSSSTFTSSNIGYKIHTNDNAFNTVNPVGDINKDGFADIIIGNNYKYNKDGRNVFVIYGASTNPTSQPTIIPTNPTSEPTIIPSNPSTEPTMIPTSPTAISTSSPSIDCFMSE